MSDYTNTNGFIFNFQIHHIFPTEIFGVERLSAFLSSVGITIDMTGNKIALPGSPTMHALFSGSSTL